MAAAQYDYNVFLNCPFDSAFRPIFQAIVFAVHDCGYIARCSLEIDDASEVRIEKISKIISSCRFGVHDISRTELDTSTGLPRFNMPLELGIFLGAKRFGRAEQKRKSCLILDVDRYRYQKYISDIAGQDIVAHDSRPEHAINAVRNWLSNATPKDVRIPSAVTIAKRYRAFDNELPEACAKLRWSVDDLTFNNFVVVVEEWVKAHADIGD